MAEAQRESEADVDAMRRMLEESADVCRAIMGGEVDAFVVGAEDGNRRVLLLATAFFGSAGVIIAGKQDTGLLAGLAGLAVVVQTPGIAIRSRGNNYWHVITAFSTYIVAVLVRLWLRDDGATAQFGEVALKLLVPPTAFGLVWLMARALNQRLMEALEESERSRSANDFLSSVCAARPGIRANSALASLAGIFRAGGVLSRSPLPPPGGVPRSA